MNKKRIRILRNNLYLNKKHPRLWPVFFKKINQLIKNYRLKYFYE